MNQPTKKFNFWLRITGRYNFCDPNEEQAEYIFRLRPDAPKGLHCTYVVKFDYEPSLKDDALPTNVATELLKSYESYWLTGNVKTQLQELLAYLKTKKVEDRYDSLRYNIDYAVWEIEQAEKRLLIAESDYKHFDTQGF